MKFSEQREALAKKLAQNQQELIGPDGEVEARHDENLKAKELTDEDYERKAATARKKKAGARNSQLCKLDPAS